MDGEVGGVDVVHGHFGDEPGAQEGAERGEDQSLVALLLDIVEEESAEHVAGERGDAAAAEPGGFAGAGQADGQHHVSLGRLAGGIGLRSGYGDQFGLGFHLVSSLVRGISKLAAMVGLGAMAAGCGGRRGRRRRRFVGTVGGKGFVVIAGNQRTGLIRREFLADSASGFGEVGTASGASSH